MDEHHVFFYGWQALRWRLSLCHNTSHQNPFKAFHHWTTKCVKRPQYQSHMCSIFEPISNNSIYTISNCKTYISQSKTSYIFVKETKFRGAIKRNTWFFFSQIANLLTHFWKPLVQKKGFGIPRIHQDLHQVLWLRRPPPSQFKKKTHC